MRDEPHPRPDGHHLPHLCRGAIRAAVVHYQDLELVTQAGEALVGFGDCLGGGQ